MTPRVAQASPPARSSDCLSLATLDSGGTPALQNCLCDPAAYPHPVDRVRLIETHISWVFLAGNYAYKLKKPVNFGFLDFSTLDKREFCCREELRLNRRLAPETYLDVVPVAGTPPKIGGAGTVLDWAVRMRAFPADATLDREPEITRDQIDAIADRVAVFHGAIAAAPADSDYGTLAAIQAPVTENFRVLRDGLPAHETLLAHLEAWTLAESSRLASLFATRRQQGFIRECHGDLHLGNIAWVAGAPLIFDGIEFNPGLRHIDVISEIAFLVMDLSHRGREELAWRFLNRYLEHSGDYAGLATLPYYLVYRALVRAKVSAIRSSQASGELSETLSYLALAQRFTHRPAAMLLLMHGVSGSGKTWVSQTLLERLAAVRLRSDVERKRLFGLSALAESRSLDLDIYSREAGTRTLTRLLELTETLLTEGFRVIVDATFIKRDWREPFQRLAEARALPWHIASLAAPPDVLRKRILARQAGGRDASEANAEVLAAQLAASEPFSTNELPHVLCLCGDPTLDIRLLQTALS